MARGWVTLWFFKGVHVHCIFLPGKGTIDAGKRESIRYFIDVGIADVDENGSFCVDEDVVGGWVGADVLSLERIFTFPKNKC